MAVKRKKLWIILAVVCGVIFTLGLVFGLAFRLKKVDIEFVRREDPSRLEYNVAEKIKEDGEFEFGKNILFMNFDESIAKIEKANPYVKVSQVIKAFPNIVRVYIVERVPQYRVQDEADAGKWYILDEDFKVLETVKEEDEKFEDFFDGTLEISSNNLTIGGEDNPVEVGDFLKFTNGYDSYFNEISDGLYAVVKSSVSAYGIEIEKDGDNLVFTLTMQNSIDDGMGCQIKVYGAEKLYEKIVKGVTLFQSENEKDNSFNTNTNIVYVYTDSDGEIKASTYK